jgi:hypothetical protein
MLENAKPHNLVLFLRSRKGFIKLALSTGSSVAPVFGFGMNGSYGYWLPKGRLMEMYSRYIGYFPLVFWYVRNVKKLTV